MFIAVVIMGILLFISFAVVNITIKSTLFASSGRDSQYAFYAADAGVECAIYWDSMVEPSKFDISAGGGSISCAGNTISIGRPIPGGPTSTFSFIMNQGLNPVPHCAVVEVGKHGSLTIIESHGYNTCDTANPRRVERGLEVRY